MIVTLATSQFFKNNNNNNYIIFSPQLHMPKVAPSIPQMDGSHPFLKPQLH